MELTMYAVQFFTLLVILLRGSCENDQNYTSSTLCSRGNNQTSHYYASCEDKVTNSSEVGIIAVTKVMYGAKPSSKQCALNGSMSECCSYVDGEDCLNTDVIPSALAEDCNGAKWCEARGRLLATSSVCMFPKLFDGDTTYSMFEYQCINLGLLENMCHKGVIQQGQEWYLASNVYFQNKDQDDHCFCKFSTTCGNHVVFEAIDVRLARTASSKCGETIFFSDVKKPEYNHTVTCYEKHLQLKPLFKTHSNVGTVNMTVWDVNHLGKVWIRVTSSCKNATVRLHCGLTASNPIIEDHLCKEDKLTTTVVSTGSPDCKLFPELCDEHNNSYEQQKDDLGIGAIVGIVIAGIVVLVILFIILILLLKRRLCYAENKDHEYSTTNPINNDYDNLRPPAFYLNETYNGAAAPIMTAPGFAHSIRDHDYTEILDDGYEIPKLNNIINEAIVSDVDLPTLPKTSV